VPPGLPCNPNHNVFKCQHGHCLLLCLCATMRIMRYSVCFAVVGIAVLAHTADAKPMLSRRTNDVWEGKCEDHCECASTALETTNRRHNRAQAA
jgi:hypothetical protein